MEIEQIKQQFLKESTFKEIYDLQKKDPIAYKSVLVLLLNQGVELSVGM
jgi:hypothetical protein